MKLHIKENDAEYSNNTEGVVNIKVPNLFEYNEYELESLIDWCNDYLSGYGLDAYVQRITTSNGLDVFYEIEDFEYSSHEEVTDTINQAVTDFFANTAE